MLTLLALKFEFFSNFQGVALMGDKLVCGNYIGKLESRIVYHALRRPAEVNKGGQLAKRGYQRR